LAETRSVLPCQINRITHCTTIKTYHSTAVLTKTKLLPHCVSKNDTDVAHYNLDGDQPLLIIFGREVAERACFKEQFVIPPLLTNVSALPGET